MSRGSVHCMHCKRAIFETRGGDWQLLDPTGPGHAHVPLCPRFAPAQTNAYDWLSTHHCAKPLGHEGPCLSEVGPLIETLQELARQMRNRGNSLNPLNYVTRWFECRENWADSKRLGFSAETNALLLRGWVERGAQSTRKEAVAAMLEELRTTS